MARLSSLREVRLSANRLAEFPEALLKLDSLDLIDLSVNNLKNLRGCDFSHLQVRSISYIIGSGLNNSQQPFVLQAVDLNLDENFLVELVPTLAKAKNLKILRLQNNQLTLDAIPEALFSDTQVRKK